MTVFQILDSFAQDLVIENETDTTREVTFDNDYTYDSDEEYKTYHKKKNAGEQGLSYGSKSRVMIIHIFATNSDGNHLRINLEGFEPYFYVKVPENSKSIFETILKMSCEGIKVKVEYVKRKVLFGYTGGRDYNFAKLSVSSLRDFRNLKNAFLSKENQPIFSLTHSSKPLEVFEANLDPMLRFFHLRKIQTCGWATILDNPEINDSGILELNARWDDIKPYKSPPVAVAPFLLASWDIECYSENGEFPLPVKNYERVVNLLYNNARSAEDARYLLLNAILYPENPPNGMDALRGRSGVPMKQEHLEFLFKKDEFNQLLEEALELRDKDKSESIQAIAKCLKPLEKLFPLAGDPVIQIGVVLQRGQLPPQKHIFVLGACDAVPQVEVYSYKTEREMILGWAKMMKEWNVDILMGYNTFGFDERYLWLRAEELRIHQTEHIQALTRLNDAEKQVTLDEKFLSSSALGDNTMYIWSTHGRLQVDLYHYVKRSYPLASYKLDDVCQNFMSGSLKSIDTTSSETWTIKTGTTADIVVGRAIVLLDETGDCIVEKLIITEIIPGAAIYVSAPNGDDAADIALIAATAVKWAIVKDDVSPQEIFKFHRGSSADRAKIAKYCIQDCVLVLDLYKKLDVFNNAMAMANACSVPIGYIFTRGQGIKIESLIFKECHERGQVIITLPNASNASEESYEGAIVLDPIPGFYFDSPVGVADFASLYPSTIISENISYDTLVWVKNYSLNGSFIDFAFGSDEDELNAEPGVRWTDIEFDIWGSDPEDKRKSPTKIKTGLRICRYAQYSGSRKGALPEIVQKLLATRKAKRKEAEKESDPFKKALLDAEQLAYKLTANSLYGQLGSGTFKIRLQHLAASVTAYGRKQILFAKDVIEEFYGPKANNPECSAEITYGDTDSLFVNFNVKDKDTGEPLKGDMAIEATMRLTEEAGKFVTRALKAPHDFEYDKVFYPFIIFSKKRYVGNKYEGSIDYYSQTSMGIATKRRDYAGLVKVIYGGALRILLTDKDIPKALKFVEEKLFELVDGKMSLNHLTMSKSLRAEYKMANPPAHKILAERIKQRDPGNAPASGERVQFIYVMPQPGQVAAKLQGDRVETPSYIRAKGLKPDYRFYIEHQLMNPIVQLFSLVADKIPGVIQPKCTWSNASISDREIATTNAIFGKVLNYCDKLSVRAFGASFFGTSSASPVAPVAAAIQQQHTINKPLQSQQKIQPRLGYFIDKMIVEKMEKEKRKRNAQNKKLLNAAEE